VQKTAEVAYEKSHFCKEGTRALIFETGDASCFSSLAEAVGVDICYMNGTPLKEDKHSDFEVDTGLVSRYLELFYGKY